MKTISKVGLLFLVNSLLHAIYLSSPLTFYIDRLFYLPLLNQIYNSQPSTFRSFILVFIIMLPVGVIGLLFGTKFLKLNTKLTSLTEVLFILIFTIIFEFIFPTGTEL